MPAPGIEIDLDNPPKEMMEKAVRALYESPRHRFKDAAKRCRLPIQKYIRLLARAALEGLYEPYVLLATIPMKNRKVLEDPRAFLRRVAEEGDLTKVGQEFGVSEKAAHRWLLPAEFAYDSRKFNRNATLHSPEVMDTLTENVLRELAREDQIQAALADKRWKLASKLYDEANFHWDRAHDLATENPVPAQALRAVVEAAHNAVRDAQLLSGQATDRVEGFLQSLNTMSEEELLAFINEPVLPRQYHGREDSKVKVEEIDELEH